MTAIGEFFNGVKEARFTFTVIWDAISSLCRSIAENPDIKVIRDVLSNFLDAVWIPLIIIAIVGCLAISCFGKKIIGILKFVACFFIGFCLGAHFLPALFPPEVRIPAWLVGIVVALIAAVLYRFIYIIAYVIFSGYSMYLLAFYVFFIQPSASYSPTRALVSLIAAAVAVVIAFIFRKYIEMLGTSLLGSWFAVLLFAGQIYDFTAWPVFSGIEALAIFIPTAIFTALGFIVQIKTRSRY